MTQDQEAGGLHEHTLADRIGIEIMIARDRNAHQLVSHAARDGVLDRFLVVMDGLQHVVDAYVVIAFALKIFLKIAPAGFEKIVVHSAFLEHGNISLEHAVRNFGLLRRHLDDGPASMSSFRLHAPARSVVIQLLQLDFRLEPVFLAVLFQNALHATPRPRTRNMLPPVDDGKTPTGGFENGIVGKLGDARDGRRVVFGSLAFLNFKRQEYLLRIFSLFDSWCDPRIVETISLKQAMYADPPLASRRPHGNARRARAASHCRLAPGWDFPPLCLRSRFLRETGHSS